MKTFQLFFKLQGCLVFVQCCEFEFVFYLFFMAETLVFLMLVLIAGTAQNSSLWVKQKSLHQKCSFDECDATFCRTSVCAFTSEKLCSMRLLIRVSSIISKTNQLASPLKADNQVKHTAAWELLHIHHVPISIQFLKYILYGLACVLQK